MADDSRLGISIVDANGKTWRWSPDELKAQDVATGLTFGTSVPGGFKDMTCNLLRRITADYPDQNLFDEVRVYGPGNQTVWSGRQQQFPRNHADTFSIVPSAVGFSAHLKDDASFREIYVDRDLTAWIPPSVQRELNLIASWGTQASSVAPDNTTGQSSLKTGFLGPWTVAPGLARCEGWYDADRGLTIGSLYFAWKKNANVASAAFNWDWRAKVLTDDVDTVSDNTGNLQAAGPGTGTLTATATNRRFAEVELSNSGAGGAAGEDYSVFWTVLAVYGNHGLTKQGTNSATGAQGFYASDVIANIVSRAAPLLNYTTGAGGSIQATSFVIPHLVFKTAVTAEAAILATNAFHLWDWGVYSGGYEGFPARTFFFRPADPTRLTWVTRIDQGAHLSLEGDQADTVFNGVLVTYTQPDGTTHTVGPPGSTAEATDASLQDTSVTNPVNSHGIPRKWGLLNISQVTTQAGAIQLGAQWLIEAALPSRRGTLEVVGRIKHPTAGMRPVWEVRAGDFIRLEGHPVDVPRRIIETRYSHDERKITLSLDNSVHRLDAWLERMGAALTGII